MNTIVITGASSGLEPGAAATDFSGRSMEMVMPDNLPDYMEAGQKFMASISNSDRVPATAEQIAEGIYAAATDGKSQLRYPLGDAGQTIAIRQQVGDEAFIANIRQSVFGQ